MQDIISNKLKEALIQIRKWLCSLNEYIAVLQCLDLAKPRQILGQVFPLSLP